MSKKPIKIGSKAFLKLQQQWYRKDAKLAAKRGEKDVERYIDMNRLPVTTMPRMHGPFLYQPDTDELDEDFVALADTDKAGFWREVGRKAAEMKEWDKDYVLICAFAESGTYAEAAQEAGVDYERAKRKIRKWLGSHGLKEATGYSRVKHEPAPEPAPCRTLTKAEIAKLDYQQPRSKK